MTIEELKREALRLDPSGRADLARELLESLDDLPEAEVERLWLEEAERRRVEVQSGNVTPIPMDEVFARARAARA
ncbi:MAG: addiction module protein [Coriobacteriia bacterium]